MWPQRHQEFTIKCLSLISWLVNRTFTYFLRLRDPILMLIWDPSCGEGCIWRRRPSAAFSPGRLCRHVAPLMFSSVWSWEQRGVGDRCFLSIPQGTNLRPRDCVWLVIQQVRKGSSRTSRGSAGFDIKLLNMATRSQSSAPPSLFILSEEILECLLHWSSN